MKLDVERCRRGMQQLHIIGRARPELIEQAIALIGEHPVTALQDEYLGIKNYAHFGDQRADCPYGMGPKHGSIVFSIGRTPEWRADGGRRFTDDAIYLLEAYRDFEPLQWGMEAGRNLTLPLCDAIREFDRLSAKRNLIADAFEKLYVVAEIDKAG